MSGGVNSAAGTSLEEEEEIHTLFISSLPEDVTERELYLLFRLSAGYQRCLLKRQGHGLRPVAFAVFDNHLNAIAARDALNGVTFDPYSGIAVQMELAKANSKATKRFHEDGASAGGEKKVRTLTRLIGSKSVVGYSNTLPQLGSLQYSMMGQLPLSVQSSLGIPPAMQYMGMGQQYGPGGAYQGDLALMGSLATQMPGQINSPVGSDPMSQHAGMPELMLPLPAIGTGRQSQNPPCTTLFISNLHSELSEDELQNAFRSMAGFRKLRVQSKSTNPVAFVEFDDISCSSLAMQRFQGVQLVSSSHGGLHIEYAKTKMGQPGRNSSAQSVTSSVGA
eukprot:TRINITY_DN1693_c0_g1_i1.p1 TRINITY_DN1693_c0_g1~~TRINITY_DN1693_c0_g1_i1.p1  ORF type:complete len:363 (-),score=66.72 TRINITY_DN1693_c0_g1_i1:302-1306(-)